MSGGGLSLFGGIPAKAGGPSGLGVRQAAGAKAAARSKAAGARPSATAAAPVVLLEPDDDMGLDAEAERRRLLREGEEQEEELAQAAAREEAEQQLAAERAAELARRDQIRQERENQRKEQEERDKTKFNNPTHGWWEQMQTKIVRRCGHPSYQAWSFPPPISENTCLLMLFPKSNPRCKTFPNPQINIRKHSKTVAKTQKIRITLKIRKRRKRPICFPNHTA